MIPSSVQTSSSNALLRAYVNSQNAQLWITSDPHVLLAMSIAYGALLTSFL